MQTVLSEKKATKYLKAKDIENIPQLQKELNILIKQEFPNNSPKNEVYQIATAMIRAKLNSIPSRDTMLTFLEEERDVIEPKLPSDLYKVIRCRLRRKESGAEQSAVKTPKSKTSQSVRSKWSKDTDKTEDDDDDEVDLDEADFDLVVKITKGRERQSQVQETEENDAYILQRLKEAATKITAEQIIALVKYHIKHAEVIEVQQEAANIIRRSVDAEFHGHFELPHNDDSVNNIPGSMYLKALLEAYYDLRPGASSNSYKEVQKVIDTFGVGEKDKPFDVRKYSTKTLHVRGNYEMVYALVSGPREQIKPVQETAVEVLRKTATVEPRMLEFVLDKIQKIQRSTKEIALEEIMLDIVDRYVHLQETIGPAKETPQPDKKKGEKSATANPAVMNGAKVQCQICGSEHNATFKSSCYEWCKSSVPDLRKRT